MKKYYQSLLLLLTLISLQAKAVCPVCTVVVGAGVGLSHMLGIDDTISGLWIGGLTISLIIWTLDAMQKRKISFKYQGVIVSLAYYIIIVLPLYPMGIIGNPLNTLVGVDKLILGIVIGSVLFYIATLWYLQLKKENNGHAYFPFQKVVMPVCALIIPSIIFYFITR